MMSVPGGVRASLDELEARRSRDGKLNKLLSDMDFMDRLFGTEKPDDGPPVRRPYSSEPKPSEEPWK